MRAAYAAMAISFERMEQRLTQTIKAVESLEKAMLVMSTQRELEAKHACPDPGSCLQLTALLADMEKRTTKLEDDRNVARGALVILGILGTALVGAVTKLLADSMGKHP